MKRSPGLTGTIILFALALHSIVLPPSVTPAQAATCDLQGIGRKLEAYGVEKQRLVTEIQALFGRIQGLELAIHEARAEADSGLLGAINKFLGNSSYDPNPVNLLMQLHYEVKIRKSRLATIERETKALMNELERCEDEPGVVMRRYTPGQGTTAKGPAATKFVAPLSLSGPADSNSVVSMPIAPDDPPGDHP